MRDDDSQVSPVEARLIELRKELRILVWVCARDMAKLGLLISVFISLKLFKPGLAVSSNYLITFIFSVFVW